MAQFSELNFISFFKLIKPNYLLPWLANYVNFILYFYIIFINTIIKKSHLLKTTNFYFIITIFFHNIYITPQYQLALVPQVFLHVKANGMLQR